MKKPIYLDYAATTPIDPRVVDKMAECLTSPEQFGNPTSRHIFGFKAAQLVDEARAQVGACINAASDSIVFTSGATEANNLAIKGIAEFHQRRGKHIICCQSDHKAILDPCDHLARSGYEITYLSPQKNGLINTNELKAAIREDTVLVTTVYVNSETGIIQNAKQINELAHERGVFCHLDAAQAIGKIAIDVADLNVDLMSLSAHKAYGPKGVGVLYIKPRPRVRLAAQSHGGGHEHGLRSGTLATHQIVGMGEAFHLAQKEFEADQEKYTQLRNLLWSELQQAPELYLNGDAHHGVASIINISVAGVDNAALLNHLPHLAISTGSACTSGSTEPSYVLRSMGISKELAASALRISFGRFTAADEIRQATRDIITAIKTLRGGV
jgi:cysteine desulfurase